MNHSSRHLLLTGPPGIGKTTVIQRVAERLPGRRLRGFYTEEIRQAGERRGFCAATFGGEEVVIAHVDLRGAPRVGRYGVDVPAIDRLVDRTLTDDEAADLFLVDEIGKMESLSPRFVATIERLLDGRRPIVATIGQRGGGLMARVRGRADIELWQVTGGNRDQLPARVLEWIRDRL